MTPWADPRVYITAALIGLFGYAYIHDPSDEAMKGALIAAFAAAYGYWIGSSSGAMRANDRTDKALDIAAEATRSIPNADHGSIREGDAVTLTKEEGATR